MMLNDLSNSVTEDFKDDFATHLDSQNYQNLHYINGIFESVT